MAASMVYIRVRNVFLIFQISFLLILFLCVCLFAFNDKRIQRMEKKNATSCGFRNKTKNQTKNTERERKWSSLVDVIQKDWNGSS